MADNYTAKMWFFLRDEELPHEKAGRLSIGRPGKGSFYIEISTKACAIVKFYCKQNRFDSITIHI
ncbi:MAG TPA: hypothetical protein PLL71_03545 [Agriterribacter sp.]|nr:hypothetical protein [Agriterribacter sp.]